MPRLPGICKECGAIYPSPLRADGPEADPAFEVPVPCPACGGSGAVPPDVLRRLGRVVEAGARLADDSETLEALEAMLEEAALPAGAAAGEGETTARRARLRSRAAGLVTGGGPLADALPGLRVGEVGGFCRLLRLAAGASVEETAGAEGGEGRSARAGSVESLLEEAYRRYAPEDGQEVEPDPAAHARRRLAEAGRNDPCPCGSGAKYKDCHWMEDLRTTR